MKQCYTQKQTMCNAQLEQAHEYISKVYQSVQHQDKSFMDWLVCHCSPNTYVLDYADNAGVWDQPNTDHVCRKRTFVDRHGATKQIYCR